MELSTSDKLDKILSSLYSSGDYIKIVSEQPEIRNWSPVYLDEFENNHIRWCIDRYGDFGEDFQIVSFRERNRSVNSHMWFFKDRGMALLFAMVFAGEIYWEKV